MQLDLLAALARGNLSDVITEALGVVAVCSFLAIAFYLGFIMLRDSSRNQVGVSGKNLGKVTMPTREERPPAPKISEREEELKRAEKKFADTYDGIVEVGTGKLERLSEIARDTFTRIAEAYASSSYGLDGETSKARMRKFGTVCERQWGFMRGDIGYMSYLDIQEHLRHILENHRQLNTQKTPSENEVVDMSPEVIRSQELVSLLRVVSRDKIRNLQGKMLDAVEDFGTHYERELRKWIADVVVKLTTELRRKKSNGIDITDTEYLERYKRLRSRLEIASYLSDRISLNTQKVTEDSLALSQIIYVGTLLRILTSMPEWFGELELNRVDSDDDPVASSCGHGSDRPQSMS